MSRRRGGFSADFGASPAIAEQERAPVPRRGPGEGPRVMAALDQETWGMLRQHVSAHGMKQIAALRMAVRFWLNHGGPIA